MVCDGAQVSWCREYYLLDVLPSKIDSWETTERAARLKIVTNSRAVGERHDEPITEPQDE